MKPLVLPKGQNQDSKKRWESPAIVLEYSLVAKAQDPFGEDGKKVEEDPFLGAFTTSGV